MNLGLLSLLLLALAIVVGFLWNGNVGLLCVGLAMVLTLFYGESISAEDVISGFNTSLFRGAITRTLAASKVSYNSRSAAVRATEVFPMPGFRKRPAAGRSNR